MKTRIPLVALALVATFASAGPVKITDVFANTSWRQKKLIVETEFESADERPHFVQLEVAVKDAAGKVVKRLSEAFGVNQGLTVVKPEIPWADPITWELGRGYLYTMEVRAKDGAEILEYPAFRFGFREVWRDGREIYMNGHIQRFRPCYYYSLNKNGADFLHDIGFNTIFFAHRIEPDPKVDPDLLYYLAEHGMAVITATACFSPGRGKSSPELIAKNIRRYRNIPSCVAFYFGVNVKVPFWDKDPRWIGDGSYDWFSDLYKAGKTHNPNALFFSHADGSCCDLATGNLYLNFTPLQEREDWLRKWANPGSGDYPYMAVEFGHPFYWVWTKPGFPAHTEYYAMYFGDDVYTEESEPMRLMRRHIFIRRVQFPYYWKFHELFTWRTFRSWRTYGLNGGVVPFNIEEGYGMPGWDWQNKLWNQYGVNYSLKEPVKGRPDWAWPSYDYYQLGNKDFLGYIAGYPDHTHKRHAYWGGEKVTKNAVFIWDYFEPKVFTAHWKVEMEGKTLATGKITQKCEYGPIVLKDFSFTAPEVSKKTPAKMTLLYRDDKGQDVFTDTFDLEFYPAYARAWAQAPECYLVDPAGDSAAMLAELGIPNVKRVKSCADVPDSATHVVIGRMALSTTPLALSPEAIERGLKVLVLPQMPKSWQQMGFTVEDTMSRCMFPRDTVSPSLKGLTKDMLHDWAGQAVYGDSFWTDANGVSHNFGNICWNGERGPRWTRDMVVSGVPFRMPTTVGFLPQIDGEFDMNYAGLMTFYAKKGSITFCQMDFEGRVKTDPAATMTADAVIAADFLGSPVADHSRPVYASGKAAADLLTILQQPFTALAPGAAPPAMSVCVVSPDSPMTMEAAAAAAKSGAEVVFYCHTEMAKKFGITTEQKIDVYRVARNPENPLLRGIGPANLRWRDFFDYPAFTGGASGWKFDMDGMLAYGKIGEGRAVFCQLDPTLFRRRMFAWEDPKSPLLPTIQVDLAKTLVAYTNQYAGIAIGGMGDTLKMAVEGRVNADKWARVTVRPDDVKDREWELRESSVERMYQFWARLLTNLGADPGEDALRRLLWAKELRQIFEPLPRPLVLGRLPVGTAEEPDFEKCREAFMKPLPTEQEAVAGTVKAGTQATGPNGTTATWDDSKMEYRADGIACLWKTVDGADWTGWSVNLLVYTFDVPEGEGRRLRFYTRCPLVRIALNGREIEPGPLSAPSFTKSIPVKPGRNVLAVKALSHKGEDRDLVRASLQVTDASGMPLVPPSRAGAVGFAAAPRPRVLSALNVGTVNLADNISLNGKDLDGATASAPADAPNISQSIPVKIGRNTLVVKALTHGGAERDTIRVQFCRTDAKGRPFTESYLPGELVENLSAEEAAKIYVPLIGSGVLDKVFYGPFRKFDAYDWHSY